MFYYMHNNNNYQCKICWSKALTFGVGSIQLSFRTIVFTQYMQRCFQSKYYYIHFSQIVPRVCTLVLFIIRLQVWCSLKSVTTTLSLLFSQLHILHCTVVIMHIMEPSLIPKLLLPCVYDTMIMQFYY